MATILVIDDRDINIEYLEGLLKYTGHEVYAACDGLNGINILKKISCDLIITDILMPNLDGYEFVKKIKQDEVWRNIPIIFYTALYRSEEAEQFAKEFNVQRVLIKPAEPQDIISIVSSTLGLDDYSKNRTGSESVKIKKILESHFNQLPSELKEIESELLDIINSVFTEHGSIDYPEYHLLIKTISEKISFLEKMNAKLFTLRDLTLDLISEKNIYNLLSLFANGVRKIVEAECAIVGVFDKDDKLINFVTSCDKKFKLHNEDVKLSIQQPFVSKIIESSKIFKIKELSAEQSDLIPYYASKPQSIIAAPFLISNQTKGFVYFVNRMDGMLFSVEDIQYVETLVSEVSILYENIELYNMLQKHAAKMQVEVSKRQQVEYDIKQHLSQSEFMHSLYSLYHVDFTTEQALQYYIHEMCELKKWNIGHVYCVEEVNDEITQLKSSDNWFFQNIEFDEKFTIEYAKTFLNNADGLPLVAYKSTHTEFVDDIMDNNYFPHIKYLAQFKLQSALAVPIYINNKIQFIAEFITKENVKYNKNLIDFIMLTANQLGTILQRRENEKKLKENYFELERVHEDLKETQTQLLQHANLVSIGQLAAGVAHEINTPIQYIADNVKFLEESFADIVQLLEMIKPFIQSQAAFNLSNKDIDFLCAEIPDAIHQTLDGISKVTTIVKSMKEFSHPGGNEKSLIDLNNALLNTITISRNEWKYVADIEKKFDPEMPLAQCLPNELNQVFLNLIVNAAHAIEEKNKGGENNKGTISIETLKKGNFAEIRITDTGTGMTPEVQSKIFDPFFTTKEIGKGTGQGLSIAQSIIEGKHNGELICTTQLGNGSTFIVRLPLS